MAQHRLFQCYPRRIVMRLFDLRTQPGVGNRPQGRDTLVGAKGQVETCRAPFASGVLGQLASAVRCEAVVQPVEVTAVDLAAVGKTEQALRIEPHPVWLFSRRVVFVGMAEGALALEVIRGRCRLGQSSYHAASSVTTLPGRDTTWQEYSWNMTVAALMIPALEIPLFNNGLRNQLCDRYR